MRPARKTGAVAKEWNGEGNLGGGEEGSSMLLITNAYT